MSGASARVDHRLCMGTGMCTTIAPDAFVLGASGQASYVPRADAPLEDLHDAADNCPVQAISVAENAEQ